MVQKIVRKRFCQIFRNQKTEFEKFANFSNYFLSNRTNFELKIIEFFELFLPFRINRIINFRIESNEFRTNSNLTPPLLCSLLKSLILSLVFYNFGNPRICNEINASNPSLRISDLLHATNILI